MCTEAVRRTASDYSRAIWSCVGVQARHERWQFSYNVGLAREEDVMTCRWKVHETPGTLRFRFSTHRSMKAFVAVANANTVARFSSFRG